MIESRTERHRSVAASDRAVRRRIDFGWTYDGDYAQEVKTDTETKHYNYNYDTNSYSYSHTTYDHKVKNYYYTYFSRDSEDFNNYAKVQTYELIYRALRTIRLIAWVCTIPGFVFLFMAIVDVIQKASSLDEWQLALGLLAIPIAVVIVFGVIGRFLRKRWSRKIYECRCR